MFVSHSGRITLSSGVLVFISFFILFELIKTKTNGLCVCVWCVSVWFLVQILHSHTLFIDLNKKRKNSYFPFFCSFVVIVNRSRKNACNRRRAMGHVSQWLCIFFDHDLVFHSTIWSPLPKMYVKNIYIYKCLMGRRYVQGIVPNDFQRTDTIWKQSTIYIYIYTIGRNSTR